MKSTKIISLLISTPFFLFFSQVTLADKASGKGEQAGATPEWQ